MFAQTLSSTHHSPCGIPYLRSPGVILLSKPDVDIVGLYSFLVGLDENFLQYTVDPDVLDLGAQLCKVAGQLCYMSFGKGRTTNAQAKRYFDNIKSSSHGSVLEHANYTFLLYGISRSCTHELVRHRAGFAYSQVSQRYVSGKTLRFVERPEYQNDEQLHTQFIRRIERIADEYHVLTKQLFERQDNEIGPLSLPQNRGQGELTDLRKKVQQVSRSILPNETEAPIIVTGNVRAWRHFIEMRASRHAETEIRALAISVLQCFLLVESLLFNDYTIHELPDGTLVADTKWRKV